MSLRVGVDVGGTFTDAVAIDARTRELVASVKVLTTHQAKLGVTEGIVESIARLLQRGIEPESIAFIAHSTTQATNALLEGDVARVGIVGLLHGFNPLAPKLMRIPPFEIAVGVSLSPEARLARLRDDASIERAIALLADADAEVIVATAAFGVDRTADEDRVVECARKRGLFATSGHDVSSLYGLRARTRAATLNASILPRMVQTARLTARAVRESHIQVPLMVMRSDGGVMSIDEVERRPIETLLSGPAAGIAGALLYEQVSDGIFIEVGGTSSDCSAIRAGRPQLHPARIGNRRMMMRTLDVRTVGIGGGSMLRVGAHGELDVGPRSAHIAGCHYASFTAPEQFGGAGVARISPTTHDPRDYVILATANGERIAVTPTCAANFLDLVPEGAFARGKVESVKRAFELVGSEIGVEARVLARRILEISADKLATTVSGIVRDYALDPELLVLVGGGGGASALVPFLAERLSLPYRIAKDAEVISPIGVALALVRDSVERTLLDPSPADIASLRRMAADRVIAAGAAPDRIQVSVEIDTQRNRVRATASGATALVEGAALEAVAEEVGRSAAARSLRVRPDELSRVDLTKSLGVYSRAPDVRVVDERGVVRLALRDARIERTLCGELESVLRDAIERATTFGDVGRALPDLYIVHGAQIADFGGLLNAEQAVALVKEEVAGREAGDPVAILTVPRPA
jgi:N-methylhydantoinase A